MSSAFIIGYSISLVVIVIVVFLLGLFTSINALFIVLIMTIAITINFIFAAYYVATAAARTGGKDADDANKSANMYYTNAAIISWVTIGLAVLAVIGIIVAMVYIGGEVGIADGVTSGVIASNVNLANKEALEISQRIEKEKRVTGMFERLNNQHGGFAIIMKLVFYLILPIIILLSITTGILAAIGASIQSGSTSKRGLKQAIIAACLNLFLAGTYLIFFLAIWIRGHNLSKRLKEDIAKQQQLLREHKLKVNRAKAEIAYNMLK